MLTEDGSLENDRGKWDKARITLDNGELMVELLAGKRRDIAFAIGVSQIKEMRNEGSVFKRLVLRVASPSGGGGTMYKDTSIVVHDREKWIDAIRKEQESSTKS